MKVSILMLTHSAKAYVRKSIVTVKRRTCYPDGYELIVVDNNSDKSTKKLLSKLYLRGMIDKLFFAGENLMFAKGNNVAASLASKETEFVLLLNSDIQINDPQWLEKMVSYMECHSNSGAIGLRSCEGIPRCDGFAMLIRKDLYLKYRLDEDYEWWWSVTKLQAAIRNEGYTVTAVRDYERYLHHFGGKSPKEAIKTAKGMTVATDTVESWFTCAPDTFLTIESL